MKPVFNLRGLNVLTPSLSTAASASAASASATDGGHYVAHVTAVNAKGRSDAVTIRLSLQQQRLSPQMTGHGSSGGGIKNLATGSNGSSGGGGGSSNGGKSEGQSN